MTRQCFRGLSLWDTYDSFHVEEEAGTDSYKISLQGIQHVYNLIFVHVKNK